MFKKTAPETRPAPTANGMAGTFSVLGVDLIVKGDITASADLHIEGKVEGDISCAALVQGEASVITGAITAQNARLSGTVHGAITVGHLVVLKTARIHGDVMYDALTIEQGAQVDGKFAPRKAEAEMALTLVN